MKTSSASVKLITLLLCTAMLLPLCACGVTEPIYKQLFAMDTVMTLTAYGKNASAGLDAAAGVITALDTALDPNSDGSNVSVLNNANGADVILTGQVADMLQTALEVCRNSGGALDLSVYPIYLAWGAFKEETARIPTNEELAGLMSTQRFDETVITHFPGEANYSVRMPAGTQISFGAAAKGCAANCAVEAMRDAGVESGIISLGGNVQTLGLKPDGSNWTVAVEDPNDVGSYLGTLSVGESAIVTSGSYQRYFTGNDGTVYHHLIDPSTGKPADNGLLSVTVLCSDGTLADCLSTAMFVLGEKAALKYWEKYGGFDMIMVTDDDRVICTSGLIEVFELTNTARYTFSVTD